jgi:hypothetical protein
MIRVQISVSNECRISDQATSALITDPKDRGLLDNTFILWMGELG